MHTVRICSISYKSITNTYNTMTTLALTLCIGVVYQATVIETGEIVAIKKVLQDRRFKNRELQIMGLLEHPDVVQLKHCFYSKGDQKDKQTGGMYQHENVTLYYDT